MKTVGEFKKAGLVFVNGDKGDGFCVKAHKYFGMSGVFDNKRATHFAWRENSVVKPEFSGAIDAIIRVGDNVEQFNSVISVDIFSWSLVIKWRPSLNQPSFSEPETKQSAIHKALVELGGSIRNEFQGANSIWHVSGASFVNGEYYFSKRDYCTVPDAKLVCTVKEFIDYCEKMAVEEKRMDIIGQNGNDGLHYDNTAQQVEALALKRPPERMKVALKEADDIGRGFVTRCVMMPTNPKFIDNETANAKVKSHIESLRPIFTQAMADAGELPPVGSVVCFESDNVSIRGYTKSGYPIFECKNGTVDSFNEHSVYSVADTRTDKQKDIDAAFLSVNVDKPTLEVIYDLWRVGEKC